MVEDYLAAHPDFFTGRQELFSRLIPPDDQEDGVVSFDQAAISSYRRKLQDLNDDQAALLSQTRLHLDRWRRVHDAVLMLIDSFSVSEVATVVREMFPVILDADAARLCFEETDHPGFEGLDLRFLPPGSIAPLMRGKDQRERQSDEERLLSGKNSARVEAETLIRLDAGGSMPPGVLLLGWETADKHPSLSQDLFTFLRRVLEKRIKRCLHLTDA